jgi:hypothetical protein
MSINTRYIQSSIPDHERTAKLAARIRMETTGFKPTMFPAGQRGYLSSNSLTIMLMAVGYSRFVCKQLIPFIQENIQHAFERGVFIVSSRSVSLGTTVSVDSPQALLAYFRDKEPEAFTPTIWYEKQTYSRSLYSDKWSHEVAITVGAFTLRHVRAAFAIGMRSAAEKIVC